MRKHHLTGVILLIFSQASAQIEKGKIYPGITLNRSEAMQYGVQPSASVGLGKHGLLVVHLSFMHGKNFYYADSRSYGSMNGAGINYSYFRFFKNSQKLGWYATAGVTYHRVNVYQVKNDVTMLNNKYGQTDLYLKPGLFFKASPQLTFFANAGGIGINSSQGNNDLDISFLGEVNVGVLINFDARKRKK
jgi:hypothetical protein